MSTLPAHEKLPSEATDIEYESGSDVEYGYVSESDVDSEYALSAQQQWEESLEQITRLVKFVLIPYLGVYLGRFSARTIWRRVAERIF